MSDKLQSAYEKVINDRIKAAELDMYLYGLGCYRISKYGSVEYIPYNNIFKEPEEYNKE